jgi:hypothetical protein
MAAGDPGQRPRLDHATVTLRLALLHAEEDAERLRALGELVRGTVLAATWPNAPDAVRTLTNSDGEKAMPLFSGMDTLEHAARRFGWMDPSGSFTFRELPAREALESAIAQGVHYAVLDIYADHATEFAYHEMAQVLQKQRGTPEPAAPRTRERTNANVRPNDAAATPSGPKQTAPRLGEIDVPFAHGPASAPQAPPAIAARTPATAADATAQARAPAAQPPAQPRPPAPRSAVLTVDLPPLDESEFESAGTASPDGGASFGFGGPEPAAQQPAARPAALEAAAMVAQAAKLAGDAETKQAAAEVTGMLKDMARKGVSEEETPSSMQSAASAAKTLAGFLVGKLSPDAQRGKRAMAAAPEPAAPSASEPEEAKVEDEPEEGRLRALDPELPDAVLDAVADALRQYPEVEWACAVSDGGELPVVGLRVAASFRTREDEIRSAVTSAAQRHGREVNSTLLNDPQDVKDARKFGFAFFPWRKRAAKR